MAPEIAEDAGGPIADGGELVESTEEDVEVRPKVPVASLSAPTASQLAEHRDGGHVQYRSWCDDCVEAFGREDRHEAKDKLTGRTVPVISLDYLFVSQSLFTLTRNLRPQSLSCLRSAMTIRMS